jgi:hypothetical protein
LVQEEYGDGLTTLNSHVAAPRRVPATHQFQSHQLDDRRSLDSVKTVDTVRSGEEG